MTRDETKTLLKVITNMFPNYNPPDKSVAVEAWTSCVKDYPYQIVMGALQTYLITNTSGFAPVPSQLIELIHKSRREELSEGEAWSMVSRALQNGIYGADKEFKALPESVQKAVGSAEQLRVWATDSEYNESVISSNFKRCYRTILERQREEEKIPERLLRLMKGCEEDGNRLQGPGGSMSVLSLTE